MAYIPPDGDSLVINFQGDNYVPPLGDALLLDFSAALNDGLLHFIFQDASYIPPLGDQAKFVFGVVKGGIYFQTVVNCPSGVFFNLHTAQKFEMTIDVFPNISVDLVDGWEEIIYTDNFMSMIL